MKRNGVGTASFVLIALVLALTCFSLLALYQADLQNRMSRSSIDYSSRYYEALASISEQVDAMNQTRMDEDKKYISVQILDGQYLIARVEKRDGRYVIAERYVENQNSWDQTEPIPVWDGKD
ncbi:hypothetical protein [uncultured Dubosiella sp.]|uniref:hypothetical protein n=1 Tax=uncultured Dubosiella sp. TaxID=1937011 RepID=UPI0025B4C8FF|nr:hypothetical protein [uncultured Dubosiella sp.]